MKKFNFKISGNQYDVHILNIEGNNAKIEVNGTIYDVEMEQDIPINDEFQSQVSATNETQSFSQVSSSNSNNSSGGKGGTIKAPLPGTIIEIEVNVGDKVIVGQRILILEAMKMENVLYSEFEGVVKSIDCTRREPVKEGDILMQIGG